MSNDDEKPKKDDISFASWPSPADSVPAAKVPANNSTEDLQATLTLVQSQVFIQIEMCKVRAQLNKAYFDSMVEQGFTKEQALEMLKIKGL